MTHPLKIKAKILKNSVRSRVCAHAGSRLPLGQKEMEKMVLVLSTGARKIGRSARISNQ